MRRAVFSVVLVLLWAANAVAQQATGTRLSIGPTPTPPVGSTVRLTGLGTVGGDGFLLTTPLGDLLKRLIIKGDLPAAVGYEDEANTWALLQTMTSGLVSNGPVQINNTLGVTGLATLTGGFAAGASSSVTGPFSVSGLSTLAGGFTSGAASQVNATLGVSGLATLTGGFTAGAPSQVNSTLGVSGLTTMTGGYVANAHAQINSTLTVTGLTTLAKVKTTGMYGVGNPFTIRDTADTIPLAQFYDDGRTVLANTGTNAAIHYQATGAPTGGRNWRMGLVGGNFLLQGGEDATLPTEPVWHNLFRATQAAGTPDGFYWGVGVKDIQPDLGYQTNLGSITRKYLTGHFAELWSETIVAHETMATIGGRVLVGPTTTLTSDILASTTIITAKHNQMRVGDTIHLEANGYVEFMVITGGPVAIAAPVVIVSSAPGPTALGDESLGEIGLGGDAITETGPEPATSGATATASPGGLADGALGDVGVGGDETNPADAVTPVTPTVVGTGYSYTVTRNVDGTGANVWPAGTALFNTGQLGNGFIDLYSLRGVRTGTEVGPTIAFNRRNTNTFNDWSTYGAIGNLRGLYTYGASDIYGAAFGNRDDVWLGIDAVNGIRFFDNATTQTAKFSLDGTILLGQSGGGQANTFISPTYAAIRRGTVDQVKASSAGLEMFDVNGTRRVYLDAAGLLTLGVSGSNQMNTYTDTNTHAIRSGGTPRLLADATGVTLFDTAGVRRMQLGATSLLFFDTGGGNSPAEFGAAFTRIGYGLPGFSHLSVDNVGNLRIGTSTIPRIFLNASNGAMVFHKPDGSVGAYINSDAMYIGDPTVIGKPHFFASATEMGLCVTSRGCSLVLNGTTGNITSTGSIQIGTNGHIRGGQTAYATGTGFFLGYEALAYKFSIGDSAQYIRWSGTALTVGAQSVQLGNTLISSGSITNVTSGNLTIGATNTGATLTLGTLYSNRILINTYAMEPSFDNSTTLGSATSRFTNLNLSLPNNLAPTYVVVNKGGAGGDSGSALGYIVGFSGTKVAGACTFTLLAGVVTNVTGC